MKRLLLAGISILALGGVARADCCLGVITTQNALGTICDPCCAGGCGVSSYYHLTGCDNNEKTPSEAVQCKLDYWRKEVIARTKTRDQAQSMLDKATDRVRAFEAIH